LSSGLSIKALRSVRIVNDEQVLYFELARDLAQSAIALLGLRVPDDKAARGTRERIERTKYRSKRNPQAAIVQ
jgi:hypothetical protein